jgi:hypothetical protein
MPSPDHDDAQQKVIFPSFDAFKLVCCTQRKILGGISVFDRGGLDLVLSIFPCKVYVRKNEDMNFVGIKYRNSVHNIAIFCYFVTFMLSLSCHIFGYTNEQFVILGREEQHIGEADAAVPSSSAERSSSRHQASPEEDA